MSLPDAAQSTLTFGQHTEAARWEGASAEDVRFALVEVGVGVSRLRHGASATTLQATVLQASVT